MVKRILFALVALMLTTPAVAGPWTVGQQTPVYSYPHVLGDGTDIRGGTPPAFAYEPADSPTGSALVTQWTVSCAGPTNAEDGGCGEFADPAGANGYGVPGEAKARFDCNVTIEAHDDPIINPGVANGSTHDHTFIGNDIALPYTATYANLRASGHSTCYGGLLNRTLYWEPSMKVVKGGIPVTIKARNIITYYTAGGINDGQVMQRWPRGLRFIGGFNMADPTNTYGNAPRDAANPAHDALTAPVNGFSGWACTHPATPSYTAYSPNQFQGASQPYFADINGHPTLNCQVESVPGSGTGILVIGDVTSQNCWDGVNFDSPDGRSHMMYGIIDQRLSSGSPGGRMVCPEHWYRTVVFEAKPEFFFKDHAELGTAYLASDRMPGMTQYAGGTTMHFDLIPAWDYGTGDAPGVMLKFFQHCDGLTMTVKNATGGGSTTLTGDPHECGYGRIMATENMIVDNTAPPDGAGPNPVTNLNPDFSGTKRYVPIKNGTPLPSAVLHPHP